LYKIGGRQEYFYKRTKFTNNIIVPQNGHKTFLSGFHFIIFCGKFSEYDKYGCPDRVKNFQGNIWEMITIQLKFLLGLKNFDEEVENIK